MVPHTQLYNLLTFFQEDLFNWRKISSCIRKCTPVTEISIASDSTVSDRAAVALQRWERPLSVVGLLSSHLTVTRLNTHCVLHRLF